MNPDRHACPVAMEPLQPRLLLAIALDLVALHEFGHSLGLAHHPDTAANSIMEAYYNPNYNKANLAADPAVVVNTASSYASLLELFSATRISANTTSWKDNRDPSPGNGSVEVTYSFVPDGTVLDSRKKSNLQAKMSATFGLNWKNIFTEELSRWASVSGGKLAFLSRSDNGAQQGTSGLEQNDSRFGDIRIGGHKFDGPGGTLAHAYYPPSNGGTTAGDAHFASEETWFNADGAFRIGSFVVQPDGRLYCTVDDEHGHHDEGEHGHAGSSELAAPGPLYLAIKASNSLFAGSTGAALGMTDLSADEADPI